MRVISVHNFPKQDVTSAEEVIAAAVASENRLILALASHAIVIRNGNEEIVLPTVDQAVSVLYSSQGNQLLGMLHTRLKFVQGTILQLWKLGEMCVLFGFTLGGQTLPPRHR